MVDKNLSAITKNIKVGKFYFIHDGSRTGHPGFVVWKDDEKNIYIAIKFGTTKNDDNEILLNPISQSKTNYIYKRLFVGKRKDFGKDELCDFYLTNEIVNKYNEIKKSNLKYSKNIPTVKRRFLNWNRNKMLDKIKITDQP